MITPRRAFTAWALLTVLGAVLMALPDDDRRVVSFSRDHGPALLDFIGMLLIGVATLVYVGGLVAGRRRLRGRDGAVALAMYIPSLALTIWSVLTDTGWWWALGVVAALGALAWLAWRVAR